MSFPAERAAPIMKGLTLAPSAKQLHHVLYSRNWGPAIGGMDMQVRGVVARWALCDRTQKRAWVKLSGNSPVTGSCLHHICPLLDSPGPVGASTSSCACHPCMDLVPRREITEDFVDLDASPKKTFKH